MIYNEGAITVVGGSHVVEGLGTLWQQRGVRAGATLTLSGLVGCVQVARVLSDDILHLSAPIPDVPVGERVRYDIYAISDDFTSNFAIPYPNEGEADNSILLRRAVELLDRIVPSAGG